jgi:colicin import membrane protein
MARKLKTYQTSLGFFDLAIAAPSMKAALEAWGSTSNLFHQGVAKRVDDPAVVAATRSKPGVILRRPIGSSGLFKQHAELPRHLSGDAGRVTEEKFTGRYSVRLLDSTAGIAHCQSTISA